MALDLALGLHCVLPRLLQVNGREEAGGVFFPAGDRRPVSGRMEAPAIRWVPGSREVTITGLAYTRPGPSVQLICAAQVLGGGEHEQMEISPGTHVGYKTSAILQMSVFFFSGDRLCVLRNLGPAPLFKFSYAFFQKLLSLGFLNLVKPVVHPK